jgi:hypothetical protein
MKSLNHFKKQLKLLGLRTVYWLVVGAGKATGALIDIMTFIASTVAMLALWVVLVAGMAFVSLIFITSIAGIALWELEKQRREYWARYKNPLGTQP